MGERTRQLYKLKLEAGTAAPGKRDAAPQRLTRASLGGESEPGSASSGRRHHRAMPVQTIASKPRIRGGTGREEEGGGGGGATTAHAVYRPRGRHRADWASAQRIF